MDGSQHRLAALNEPDQLTACELADRGHSLEICVDAIEQSLGQLRKRSAEPPDAPRSVETPRCGDRVEPLQ